MARYVALLRGVNLGGRRRVAMADLRVALAREGFTDVSTFLASGNALFSADSAPIEAIGRRVEGAVAGMSGVRVAVIVREAEALGDIVVSNPLGAEPEDPSHFFVFFFSGSLGASEALKHTVVDGDRIWVRGAEAYLSCRSGIAALDHVSRLERGLRVTATTRNWRTVTPLARLALLEDRAC